MSQAKENTESLEAPNSLIAGIRDLIEKSRASIAISINITLTTLYWSIGKRINEHILKEKRSEYGKQVIANLAKVLQLEYGNGFSQKNLHHMIHFAATFTDEKIFSAARRQLSWTHFKAVMYIEDPLKREFYTEMCRIEKWSTRALQNKIDSMLYERTALSKKPKELIKQELQSLKNEDKVSTDLIFRDPYFLDFLHLKGAFHEKDIESAILREIESFLLELGAGFAFIDRQKRIQIDNEDFYIDLLFFNRNLKRLVVVELKLGNFKAEHKGQMELYLRWLDKHEKQPGEDTPLGIILCTGKKQEQIELLELDKTGIHVAEYLTVLPPKEELKKKINSALNYSLEKAGETIGDTDKICLP